MAIKSVLTALINGNWGDITSPKRLPLKDREVGQALLDNIYPTPFYDTQATTNVFTKSGLNMSYNFLITKSGRNVTISGSFKNITDFAISDQNICDITNSEFNNYIYPINQSFMAQSTTGNIVRIVIVSNVFFINGTIPTGTTFYFNLTYQVAN